MSDPLPRWLTAPNDLWNLREVGKGLYVGSAKAVACGPWDTVIDFCGTCLEAGDAYSGARAVEGWPFPDGTAFPPGALDATRKAILRARGTVLLHCKRGLSRSPAAAYAMLRALYGMDHQGALLRVVVSGFAHRYPLDATLASAREWAERQ